MDAVLVVGEGPNLGTGGGVTASGAAKDAVVFVRAVADGFHDFQRALMTVPVPVVTAVLDGPPRRRRSRPVRATHAALPLSARIGTDEEDEMSGRDVARLLLRGVIGGTMIAHGVRHGRTLQGTAGWFGSIGFRQPRMQAAASAVIEVGAGAALVAGAATPLAASAVVGTMGVAARSVHQPNGFFVMNEGYEFVLNLGAASVALAALGPGRFSVDRALGLDERLTGRQRAALAAGVGLAAAAAQLAAFWRRPQPKPIEAATGPEAAAGN